jgi:Xaa-Pro aminopeptidase
VIIPYGGEPTKKMTQARMQKLTTAIRELKIDHVLLTSPASLRYFASYTAGIETGPSPFSPVLGAFLWIAGGSPQLFLADMESSEGIALGLEITPFESYTVEKPLAAAKDLAAKLLVRLEKLSGARVGIEADDLPAAVFEPLRARCPQIEFQDISSALTEIRMVKDEEEISILREALELCDLGQALVKKLAQRGMTEIELFAEVRKGMETRAGGRLPLLADLISGGRTAQIGGPPTSRRIENGDLIISDLVPRHRGYWGDTCNTCVVGEPTSEHRKLFEAIAATLAEGIDRVRPGVRACDLDASLRKRVLMLNGGYPHHSGHGLGVTWHEEPRIVPYNPLPLQPGMVIALEPGIYFKGRFGLRLEHTILVTEKGAEILSKFQHTL